MKYPKTQIRERVEELQKLLRKLAKHAKAIAAAEQAAVTLRAEIDGIGEPDYTDDAAIQRLATAKLKLELCEKAIVRLGEKEEEDFAPDSYRQMLYDASLMAGSVLAPVVERRLETIARSLEPFCADSSAARNLATRTDAYLAAHAVVVSYNQITTRLSYVRNLATVSKVVEEILDVLTEALKDAPDVVRFLPMRAQQPAVEAPTPEPTT